MPDPTGVAVVGAGSISDYHLAGLSAVPDARIVAVTSRSIDRARRKAAQYDVPNAYADWRQALARQDVHAVVVATPDHTHREIAVAAARSGKAVLIQKPIAPTVADAEAIVTAAGESGTLACVSFMHRYFAEVQELRRMLRHGLLGQIRSIRLRNATPGPDWDPWFFDPRSVGSGGVIQQLGIHGIDLVLHLFGPVTAVSGVTQRSVSERRLRDGTTVANQVPDQAAGLYEIDGGALVTHEMSWSEVAGTDRFRLEVYGSEATAWLRYPTAGLSVGRGPDQWNLVTGQDDQYGVRQHADFIAQIRGDRAPDDTLAHSIRGLQVAQALLTSAETGCRVTPSASTESGCRVTPSPSLDPDR